MKPPSDRTISRVIAGIPVAILFALVAAEIAIHAARWLLHRLAIAP